MVFHSPQLNWWSYTMNEISTSYQHVDSTVYPQVIHRFIHRCLIPGNIIHLKYILLNRIKHHWIIKRYTYSRGKWLLFHQKVYIWFLQTISEAINWRPHLILNTIYLCNEKLFLIIIPLEYRLFIQSGVFILFDPILMKYEYV
jgi:hypothetical protein